MHKTTATIYAGPEESQEIDIEYSGEIDYSNGRRCFAVDYLKILTPITILASDLYEDLSYTISEDQHTVVARIDCEVEVTEGVSVN